MAISTKEFLLELGTEEIPARMADNGMRMIRDGFLKAMKAREIEVGEAFTYCTPRRICLHIPALPVGQEDKVVERKGPALKAAFDEDGNPTRAAQGFAKSVGLAVDELDRMETPKGTWLFAKLEVKGKPITDFLADAIGETIRSLRFPRSMRWGSGKDPFVRPIHWILALLGGEQVDVTYGDTVSGNTTRGHRFHGPEPFEVDSFDAYREGLRKASVIVDPAERKQTISEGLAALESKTGLKVVPDDELLNEVTHLVEFPIVLMGSYSERYLELPREVLITSMRSHQKYFALEDPKTGRLAPSFALVANTDADDLDVVAKGNERVLRARLEDAMFFLEEDRKKTLDDFIPGLEDQLFLKGLGSVADKGRRVAALAGKLADQLFPEAADHARRAGVICKADLVTQMVFEFTDLQGVMGREYALHHGEPREVAIAVYEHYLPRGADDDLPETDAGVALALAERADTLAGVFGLGLLPTASKDPYALRRAALGVLRILQARELSIPFTDLFSAAIDGYGDQFQADKDNLLKKLTDFTATRLKVHLADGHATELVDAVLTAGFQDVPDADARVQAVEALRGRPDYEPLITAFKRVLNITRDQDFGDFSPDNLQDEAEKFLWQAYSKMKPAFDAACAHRDYVSALDMLRALKLAVDDFFDDVMVMVDDETLRSNRLAMMATIGESFLKIADFTRILA